MSSSKNSKDLSSSIESLRANMAETHKSGENLSFAWRQHQLKQLQNVLVNHRDEWSEALRLDLGKEYHEAIGTELVVVEKEIQYTLKHLKQWMAPTHVPGPAHCIVGFHQVQHVPLLSPGVLIIGPSNFPVQITLLPAVGSLAGGNPALLKPSELCPHVSRLLSLLVPRYFPTNALQVLQGGVEETTALLQHPWGLVFFTGSERVGRIVAQATAQTLTPTVLELGGKSPVFVDETAPSDLTAVANRIIWGRTLNAGQVCVAPDYLVCHQKHADRLCQELLKSLERQFTKDPSSSELGRMVQASHAQRLVDMLRQVEGSSSGAHILCGGSKRCNAKEKYVAPTLVLHPPRNCRLLQEEIFGPVLPIVVVQSREEAIEFINERPGTPLALYVFTKFHRVHEEMVRSCPAASVMRNDVVLQASSPFLPVGGLGTSGHGRYHGRYSFDTFTHALPSSYRPCAPLLDFHMVRYHPFGGIKGMILRRILLKIPAVPVLHAKWWLVGVGAVLVARYVPAVDPVVEMVRKSVATMLEEVAAWVRP